MPCEEEIGRSLMDGPLPLHYRDETFCVRAYESGVNRCATLPAYCNYLQEIAGNHARDLGLGIQELQDEGFTWMLARLCLAVDRYAAWRENVRLRTWPAGLRGRVGAQRDFLARDDAGRTLLRGVSEWLYVGLGSLKIVRLPPAFAALAPVGTPRAGLPESSDRIPDLTAAEWSSSLTVRRSDHDFNDHVNNAHYVEWALECVPDAWRTARCVSGLDIVFRAAARWGDTVVSEAVQESGDTLLHRIRRGSDGALLTSARTVWVQAEQDTFGNKENGE